MNKTARKGFTMVELMAVLLVLSVLLSAAVPGLRQYLRFSHFQENNTQARTLYLQAQARLSDFCTGGQGEPFLERLQLYGQPTGVEGRCGIIQQSKEDDSESAALVRELIGEEAAAVCIEIDTANARVCGVFYGTDCGELVYGGAQAGQASLDLRSYEARKETCLGYYSGEADE